MQTLKVGYVYKDKSEREILIVRYHKIDEEDNLPYSGIVFEKNTIHTLYCFEDGRSQNIEVDLILESGKPWEPSND